MCILLIRVTRTVAMCGLLPLDVQLEGLRRLHRDIWFQTRFRLKCKCEQSNSIIDVQCQAVLQEG
jgi:hypothetical protein